MTFMDRLRGLIIPVGVMLLVLIVAGLGAFIWTSTYVHSVASGAQLNRSPARPADSQGRPPSPTSPATLAALLTKVHGAVWEVDTFDANGQPSVGSAFAVVSSANQTLLLTSYSVVTAATFQPAPSIDLRQGSVSKSATLRTWDAANDLALLVLDEGNQPVLVGPTPGTSSQLAQQVYVVSGAGGSNGIITTGKLSSASTAAGVVDNARQDKAARGGPLVDASGAALGVDSLDYMPAQVGTFSGGHVAVPIQNACIEVLSCPGDTFPSS